METLYKIGLLTVGGTLGTLARYGLAGLVYRLLGSRFAWGTLAVNLIGCFLVGFAAALADEKFVLGPNVRLFFMVGFLGAFTTFSTYMLESINMLGQRDVALALANVIGSTVLGLVLVILGMGLARWL